MMATREEMGDALREIGERAFQKSPPAGEENYWYREIAERFAGWLREQEPLDGDSERVLRANLWKLYLP